MSVLVLIIFMLAVMFLVDAFCAERFSRAVSCRLTGKVFPRLLATH